MKRLFFTVVCAVLFLSVPCFSAQGGNNTATKDPPNKIDAHTNLNGGIQHSEIPILSFDVWNNGDHITFRVDRNIGDVEIQIINTTGVITKTTIYDVTEGAAYSIDISALLSGGYTLLLIVPEYFGMRYEGYLEV